MALVDNLVGYWKLDEGSGSTASDSSGNSSTMTWNSTAQWGTGIIDDGIAPTSSNYLSGTLNSAPLGATARTISLWVKKSSSYASNDTPLAWGTRSNNQACQVQFSNSTTLHFSGWFADGDWTSTFNTDTWYHIVITYDGSTTLEAFSQGVSLGTQTLGAALNTTGSTLYICNQAGSGLSFNGYVDEIGIWSRVLSGSEITSLYNSGAGLQYPFDSTTTSTSTTSTSSSTSTTSTSSSTSTTSTSSSTSSSTSITTSTTTTLGPTNTINLLPNGNSVTNNGWNAEGGPSYLLVDDPVATPDDGTTKVYSPVANQTFSVTLEDSGLSGVTISKVTGHIRMYALDPVSATVQMYLTIGGTDYFSDTKDTVNNNTTYVNFTYDWSTNPATGLPWTISDVDALIMGIKKINTAGMRCTQMYVSVDYIAGITTSTSTTSTSSSTTTTSTSTTSTSTSTTSTSTSMTSSSTSTTTTLPTYNLGDPYSTSPSQFTSNNGHALTPDADLWGSLTAPYPTSVWWHNLYLADDAAKVKTHPYTVRVDFTDLNVAVPSISNSSGGVIEGFSDTIRFQAVETIVSRKITAYDELSVTNRWEKDSDEYMESPLVKGAPYISMKYNSLTPIISTAHAILTVNGSAFSGSFVGTKFKLTMNNNQTWIVYFDSSVTLTASTVGGYKLTAGSTFTGWARVAHLADSTYESDLDTYSGKIPTAGTIGLNATDDVSTITYNYTTTGTGNLLMGYLPHHQEMFTLPTYEDPQWVTIKGLLKTVVGTVAHFTQNLTTITWQAPRSPDADKLDEIEAALAEDYDITVNPQDPYFGGKAVAKLGRLALIADELGDTAKAATIRTNLETAMSEWIPAGGDETPIYESKWGGICTPGSITNSNADFGHGWYNDHHFHWGYWIYAAYCLGKGNPTWLSTYEDRITDLVRDIANPSSSDPYFTKYRHFDWYDMHSWASGLFSFGDGANQESTSEANNAYYAVYLWGDLIGNDNMRDIGRILLGLEARSTQKYWQITDEEGIYDVPYADNHVVGVLWATKVDYATFFGANAEYIHGIQIIPLTPISELFLDPDWIEQQYPFLIANSIERDYPSPASGLTINNGGSGYSGTSSAYPGHTVANIVSTTGGTGTGLLLNMNIRNSDGAITEVFVYSRGSGYVDGDIITPVINTGGLANQGSGAQIRVNTTVAEGWKNFIYGEHAVIDKEEAWTESQALTGYDDGNTKTNMLYWVATRQGAEDTTSTSTSTTSTSSSTTTTTTTTISVTTSTSTTITMPFMGFRVDTV